MREGGQALTVHGWTRVLKDGLVRDGVVRDLGLTDGRPEDPQPSYPAARAA